MFFFEFVLTIRLTLLTRFLPSDRFSENAGKRKRNGFPQSKGGSLFATAWL
jgi:hypothetical protein